MKKNNCQVRVTCRQQAQSCRMTPLGDKKSTPGDKEADASNRYTGDGSCANTGTLCVFCSINKNNSPLCLYLIWEHANELNINHDL